MSMNPSNQQAAGQALICVEHLTHKVTLGDQTLTILHDLNFTIDAGETLAIVGRSGSGKTTLLGLLAGLDLPSEGHISLAGASLTQLDEDGRARLRAQQVGFVFQSFQLLAELTALENVLLPLTLLQQDQAGGADAKARAQEMLVRVGLGERMQHYPRQLSGGEQQRVALARAFVTHPRILFADEPTGNLDAETGAQITDLMMSLNAQEGTSLIMVTHDPALAGRCRRSLIIESGRLREAAQ